MDILNIGNNSFDTGAAAKEIASFGEAEFLAVLEMSSTSYAEHCKNEITKLSAEAREKMNLDSNVGSVGMAQDFSDNMLTTNIQNSFPLATWLLNTSFARQMRRAASRGLGNLFEDPDNEGRWSIMLPYVEYTLPPADTSGACCWVPMDIAKCANKAPIYMLCLKDCYSKMDEIINRIRRVGSNDLINYFQRRGETVEQAKRRMARLTMAYMTARNLILGLTTVGTNNLKPFHGLLEVMENDAVVNIDGGNVLAAFQALSCRLALLTDNTPSGGDYVIAVHPLLYRSIQEIVKPDIWNRLPSGWTVTSTGEVRFNGLRFLLDKLVPIDLQNGVGDAWLLSGNVVGGWLVTDLMPGNAFIDEQFTANDVPADGCASRCIYYWNLGTVANSNPNYLAVVSGIPISAACASALTGLDGLITPDTLVPFV